MLKAFKYCIFPNDAQKEYIERLFNACRLVYNIALETKKRAWESAMVNLSAYELMKQLTQLKHHECQWLKEFSCKTLESEITHLDKAFKFFFKGSGYPSFKNKQNKQSAEFREGVKVSDRAVYLPKIGDIQIIQHRKISVGEIRTCTLSKEPTGKYFISILVRTPERFPDKLPIDINSAVGVDLGLKSFITLSNGSKVDNPKYLDDKLGKLRIEQRKLARRFRRGANQQSKSYQKQKLIVAKLYEKIRNKRTDFLQKLSTDLIRSNDTICIETLNISGLQKNDRLSKSISDASWGEFVRMLKYKGDWYGKNVIEIGMFEPSSKMCSNCGYLHKELTLSDRTWNCENCGAHHDRDINAAINIKNLGLKARPTTAKTSQKAVSIGCENLSL